jgi:N-acetylglucosamine-6-sulfatase
VRRVTPLILALACLLLPVPAWGAAPHKPNVVVIMTDDQTVSDLASMPQTRALIGGRGVYFRNSIVSEAQCCPSRATFFTGKYAHNHGVLTTNPPYGGFLSFNPSETLPLWLQRDGYSTVLIGKYFNGYGLTNVTYVPPGWTEWHGLLGPRQYDYYGFMVNNDGVLRSYPGRYETDALTGIAESVIRRRAAARRPLFLFLSYVAPHIGYPRALGGPDVDSAVPSPFFSGLFGDVDLPAFDEADVSDKPRGVRRRPRITPGERMKLRYAWRRRQQSLVSVDYGVTRVLDALRTMNQLDETLVVFLSDNGFIAGQHRVRHGKILPYEPSIRVPLMMRGPGVPVGRTSSQLVWNGDVTATILQATGAKAPGQLDGESLWRFIRDPRLRYPREVLIEGPPLGVRTPRPRFVGLRTDRFLYVEYANRERELYDLKNDPFELRNLAVVGGARFLQVRLARRLDQLRNCQGVDCHTLPPG